MDTSMLTYLDTSLAEMRAMDAERIHAEQFSVGGQVWAELARRYLAQGRPAQAASCQRRAEHYAQVTPVSVETLEVVYAGD